MKGLISALWLASNLAAGAAWAQPYAPNELGVTMGHWHLNSANVEANKKIFVGMGGTAIKAGVFDIVRFPGVVVMLNLRDAGAPPSGGTDGTIVNHVGLWCRMSRSRPPSGGPPACRCSPATTTGRIRPTSPHRTA